MQAYLILKDNAGPWETVRGLFPQHIPLKSIHPINWMGRNGCHHCYEIDSNQLTEEQVQALSAAIMWQYEDDQTINFERAAQQVKRRMLISKHWASCVSADFADIIVSCPDYVEAVY